MGTKLAWTGLTLVLAFPAFGLGGAFVVAGAVVMCIGVVLMWLDK